MPDSPQPTEDRLDTAIEDALRTYPLAPEPRTLASNIMARVRVLTPAPRFRLQWLDYAMSLMAATMAGLMVMGIQILTSSDANIAQLQWALLIQQLRVSPFVVPTLLGGLVFAALALLATAFLFASSRPVSAR
jgi:hypothetical protein